MAGTGSFGLLRRVGSRAQYLAGTGQLEIGDPVEVRRKKSPLSGMSGRVAQVTPDDPYGPYLVEFENGLRFRYRRHELAALTYSSHSATEYR